MIIVDEYRARAERCEREAKLAQNADIRVQLENIAQQWRELATIRERRLYDEEF